jgi:hypothetical protein
MLKRYNFITRSGGKVGVSAFCLEDAETIARTRYPGLSFRGFTITKPPMFKPLRLKQC